MNIRNLRHNGVGSFDCELEHPVFGWIPFTCSPDDTDSESQALHEGILRGQFGEPVPYMPQQASRGEVEVSRRAAYADPITGSDRLFAEAQRMNLMGESGWEAVRDQAVARFNEIRGQNPWPQAE